MFKDHFSGLANRYADFRPKYPRELFDYLVTLAPPNALVWDCACGNGQATVDLAERFERVVPTDGSREQIASAIPLERSETLATSAILCIQYSMQEIVSDSVSPGPRPIFGAGFVSNTWSGAMLEEGPGMIAFGIIMGAFCGLILGLITMQVAKFLSFTTGRNLGGVGWTLICVAIGAIAFGVMSARDSD